MKFQKKLIITSLSTAMFLPAVNFAGNDDVSASHSQFYPVGKDELNYNNKGDIDAQKLRNSDPAAINHRNVDNHLGCETRGESNKTLDMRATGANVLAVKNN